VETRRGEAHQEGEGFYDELIDAGRITDQGCFATDEGQIADRNSGGSRTISKETLTSDEIKKYLNRKTEAIKINSRKCM
jgi:hypothetical protein